MGILNLCLKLPKNIEKTRDESDQSRLRNHPKTTEKGTLRHKFRVPTRHTLTFFCGSWHTMGKRTTLIGFLTTPIIYQSIWGGWFDSGVQSKSELHIIRSNLQISVCLKCQKCRSYCFPYKHSKNFWNIFCKTKISFNSDNSQDFEVWFFKYSQFYRRKGFWNKIWLYRGSETDLLKVR